jgi:hypothetical protein
MRNQNFIESIFNYSRMPMHTKDYEHEGIIGYVYALNLKQMQKTMKEENEKVCVEVILREASTVLYAARQHAAELSEVGLSDHELNRMRVLILHVAAHSYTSIWKNVNITAEVNELKIVKDVILRAAEMRFGRIDNVLSEFNYNAQQKSVI